MNRLLAILMALGAVVRCQDIGLPIKGIKTNDLHGSFNDLHSGHRHEAIDILKPKGTPVRAVVSGTIRKLPKRNKTGGITIYQVDDSERYCYYYAHLDRYARGLREGKHVKQGDVIGHVGFTGNATKKAPHLHFAILEMGPEKQWWKGKPIDPFAPLSAAVRTP